jgi:diguanylate cyclase (GGDEF)-like protein
VNDQVERRNVALRARRDAIAAWFDLHPRQLAALPDDVVVAMSERLDGDVTLHERFVELRSTAQRWQVLARTDTLTGLANRRAAEERLAQEVERAARYSHPLTVLLADVDGFKAINDRHGHPAGDAVLRELAKRLQRVVRATDLLARWGGDEFMVVCPETDEEAAAQVAGKLVREACSNLQVGDTVVECGLSVGWTTATTTDIDPRRLVLAADGALYRSKQAGRGRATGAR